MMCRNKYILLWAMLLLHALVHAQEFGWKSSIAPVPENGFYRVPLSAEWMAHVQTGLSDVRIRDGQDKTVPFVTRTLPQVYGASFIAFPIVNNTTDSTHTVLELDARLRQGTEHLSLVIANTAVERTALLSGSNDGKQWFVIEENLLLTNGSGAGKDRFVQSLYFPFVRYAYFKLRINNRGTDPLQILKAGVFTDTLVQASEEWYSYPGTSFRQKDSSDGASYVWVHNAATFPVDRMRMVLQGPKFFKRGIAIYNLKERNKEWIASAEILSGSDPSILLPSVKASDLLVVIQNGDNPPLTISSINTQGRKRELLAYFEKGNTYTLFGGNAKVGFPQYDLAHFRDSIPAQPALLVHGPVVANARKSVVVKSNSDWWMWPGIIAMVLVLAMLTYRLMGEVKSTEA